MIKDIANAVVAAKRILFITGAGLSADSGLPTYRGVGGLYNDDNTEDGIPVEVALSGPVFLEQPALTWRYIRQIEQACRGATCNTGHRVIAALESLARVTVLTQNVDGFHHEAGSSDVIAIHGDVHDLHCTGCTWTDRVDDYAQFDGGALPRCPDCEEVIRPAIVLFGEMLPLREVARLQGAVEAGADLVFSVGTSSQFPYIIAPVQEAYQRGVPVVEINPSRTTVSSLATWRVETGAAEAFAALAAELDLDVSRERR